MRKFNSLTLATVLAGMVLHSSAQGQSQVSGWHTRLDDAQAAARETGKPIFLVFRCVR